MEMNKKAYCQFPCIDNKPVRLIEDPFRPLERRYKPVGSRASTNKIKLKIT